MVTEPPGTPRRDQLADWPDQRFEAAIRTLIASAWRRPSTFATPLPTMSKAVPLAQVVNGTGSLTAIIDWGDITRGDPATDLAGIWAVFPTRRARQSILQAYRPDTALLDRARGWAFVFGVILTDSGNVNSPRHAAAGRRILERLEADSG